MFSASYTWALPIVTVYSLCAQVLCIGCTEENDSTLLTTLTF